MQNKLTISFLAAAETNAGTHCIAPTHMGWPGWVFGWLVTYQGVYVYDQWK